MDRKMLILFIIMAAINWLLGVYNDGNPALFWDGAWINVMFTTDGTGVGVAVTVRSRRARYDAKAGGDGGWMTHLYYGDNLAVLRESIKDASVDLIYLDPPFSSKASYNVLFNGPAGADSAAQIEAFDDTWHWNDSAEEAFGDASQKCLSQLTR